MSEDKSNNSSVDNLDLSQVPTEDLDQLAMSIEKYYKQDTQLKSQLSYHWERNHMMLDGAQWIIYEGSRATGGVWKPLKVSRDNEYIPRPVTNYMMDAYQTLKSYILKNKPRCTVRPNSQAHSDKTAAKISELVLQANWERLKEDYNYEYAVSCLITYGTVFKKDFWDVTPTVTAKLPKMIMAPMTDPNTGAVTGQMPIQATDEYGQPVFEDVPLGDCNTEIIEPYRIAMDPLATDIHNAKWIMEYSVQSLDWIKTTYGKQEELDQMTGEVKNKGYTGLADEVVEETSLNNSMRRWYKLKTTSGVRNASAPLSSSAPGGYDSMISNSAIVKQYYERPSEKYPKGRLIVVANDKTVFADESPCDGPELGDWHPYSECRWEIVPGRFWGKSPLDDGAEIQKMINSIDAVIILTRKTMAIPQKLIPLGIGVEPGSWTGRPGHMQFYRDNGTGLKPETIPAMGVDSSVFEERKQRVSDFQSVTGAMEILKGDRPPGVTAASALNMLYEVGTGKLYPMLDRYKAFIENSQKKQLKLVAVKYREPRADFIRLLKAKNKDLSDEEINNFIGEDMQDNCNVVIEAGSNIPKLQAAKQAMLLEVAQTGALNLQVPTNRSEFLTELGIQGYDNDVGPDTRRAEWENDLIDNIIASPHNQPVVLDADIHQIHIDTHQLRMKQPSFMSLPPQVQQMYNQHILEHENMLNMQKQQMQMEAMVTGQPPAPPQDANAPSPLPASGSGVSQGVKNNLFADVTASGPRSGK